VDVPIPKEKVEYKIEITFDLFSGVVSLSGCDESPLVALGMLDYALARVRRFIQTADIVQEARQSPLIMPRRGPLS
jgi:hypothetical protein